MQYKIEEKEAFFVLEKVETHSTQNEQNQTIIPAFWTRADQDGTLNTLTDLASDKAYLFGICYNHPTPNEKTFDYSIAVKCNETTAVPLGFRKNCIPAKTWLVFSCVGAMPNAIQETWRKIVAEFFPTSEYRPTQEMDIEAYTQGDMDSADYYSEIWVPVEKK